MGTSIVDPICWTIGINGAGRLAWGHAHFYWLVILVLTWGQEDELGLIPPVEVDFKPPALVLEVVVAFDFEDAAFSMADGRAVVAAAWRSEFSDGLGLGSGEEICENKVAVIIALLLLCWWCWGAGWNKTWFEYVNSQ